MIKRTTTSVNKFEPTNQTPWLLIDTDKILSAIKCCMVVLKNNTVYKDATK